MTIKRLASIALLGTVLMAFGCGDDDPPDGSGGTSGTGGSNGGATGC